MSILVIGGDDGDCGGRSGLAIMSSRRIVEERYGVSFAFSTALPFPREAAPSSGAENRHGRDGQGAPGASIDERDSGEEEGWSDPVTDESGDKSGPVESITGVGEDNRGTSRSSE